MNENDSLRLRHMFDYGREVVLFTKDQTRDSIEDNVILTRAICYSTGIIGEAASKISNKTREDFPHIPWRAVISMRNFLFHAYFDVDYDILWLTATEAVPDLLSELEKILENNSEE